MPVTQILEAAERGAGGCEVSWNLIELVMPLTKILAATAAAHRSTWGRWVRMFPAFQGICDSSCPDSCTHIQRLLACAYCCMQVMGLWIIMGITPA